jgi:hypothetical protein
MASVLTTASALLVFCAPGYPGTGADAQPLVDEFAAAVTRTAGWPAGSLAAIYDTDEKSDLARLAQPQAVVAFMPWPFYVQHAAQFHFKPLAQADVLPVGTTQRWTLVMQNGHAPPPAGLAGMNLISTAAYAPDFVRSVAAPGQPWPADVTLTASGQVLSGLRRAANGEPVALLLDQEQAAALPGLPFAAQLQSSVTSQPVPVALVAVVDGRLPAARAEALKSALLKLSASSEGQAMLGRLRLKGFVTPQLPVVAAASPASTTPAAAAAPVSPRG